LDDEQEVPSSAVSARRGHDDDLSLARSLDVKVTVARAQLEELVVAQPRGRPDAHREVVREGVDGDDVGLSHRLFRSTAITAGLCPSGSEPPVRHVFPARLLREGEIPYALIGAMAVNEYGYQRVTMDVDLLLSTEGLKRFKDRYLGRGYVERFSGSKGLRDVENGVAIDIVLTQSHDPEEG
jgi:hypothetical protein